MIFSFIRSFLFSLDCDDRLFQICRAVVRSRPRLRVAKGEAIVLIDKPIAVPIELDLIHVSVELTVTIARCCNGLGKRCDHCADRNSGLH